MADAKTNFGYSTVAIPPSPPSSGNTVTVAAGQGALFPAVPFNVTIWPSASTPVSTNAEIARCTGKAGDVLTITRAAEPGGITRSIIVGDQIADTITKKAMSDAEEFYNIACLNPAGDGVTNDATILQAACTAAPAANKTLLLEAGKTYVTGSTLTLPANLLIEGNGATIKKTSTLNGYALSVTGANVEIRDLTVHGNRDGGNNTGVGCVQWRAAGGVARRVHAINSAAAGWRVDLAGAELDAYECEGTDHIPASLVGDGFRVNAGVMRLWDCRADNNNRAGFYFSNGSDAGCHVDGTANNNTFAGIRIECANGTVGRFYGSNNGGYGIYAAIQTAGALNTWTFDHVEVVDGGQALHGEYTVNPSGTGVELFGASYCNFSTIVARRNLGYGVAITKGGNPITGSLYNVFDNVFVETSSDPAFHISGVSQHNTIQNLTVRNSSSAISIGPSDILVAEDNAYNYFGSVRANNLSFAVINLASGNYNTFAQVAATDCGILSPYTSLIWLAGFSSLGPCSYNTVRCWSSENPTTADPTYIIRAEALAAHNWIASGVARDYVTSVLLDANGTNRVDFVAAP